MDSTTPAHGAPGPGALSSAATPPLAGLARPLPGLPLSSQGCPQVEGPSCVTRGPGGALGSRRSPPGRGPHPGGGARRAAARDATLAAFLGSQLLDDLLHVLRKQHGHDGGGVQAQLCELLVYAARRPPNTGAGPGLPVWCTLTELQVAVLASRAALFGSLGSPTLDEEQAKNRQLALQALLDFVAPKSEGKPPRCDMGTSTSAADMAVTGQHCCSSSSSQEEDDDDDDDDSSLGAGGWLTADEPSSALPAGTTPAAMARSLTMKLRPHKTAPRVASLPPPPAPSMDPDGARRGKRRLPSAPTAAPGDMWGGTFGPALRAALEQHLLKDCKIVCKRTVRKHIQIMPKVVRRLLQQGAHVHLPKKEWVLNSKEALRSLLQAQRELLHEIYKERGGQTGTALNKATKKKRTSINHLLVFVGEPVLKEDYTDFIIHSVERTMARSACAAGMGTGPGHHACGGDNTKGGATALPSGLAGQQPSLDALLPLAPKASGLPSSSSSSSSSSFPSCPSSWHPASSSLAPLPPPAAVAGGGHAVAAAAGNASIFPQPSFPSSLDGASLQREDFSRQATLCSSSALPESFSPTFCSPSSSSVYPSHQDQLALAKVLSSLATAGSRNVAAVPCQEHQQLSVAPPQGAHAAGMPTNAPWAGPSPLWPAVSAPHLGADGGQAHRVREDPQQQQQQQASLYYQHLLHQHYHHHQQQQQQQHVPTMPVSMPTYLDRLSF